jgi:hypothetical protein
MKAQTSGKIVNLSSIAGRGLRHNRDAGRRGGAAAVLRGLEGCRAGWYQLWQTDRVVGRGPARRHSPPRSGGVTPRSRCRRCERVAEAKVRIRPPPAKSHERTIRLPGTALHSVPAQPSQDVRHLRGADAAGKGGVIKRITDPLNPRICRVVALATPTERERGQWYFQRYVFVYGLPALMRCIECVEAQVAGGSDRGGDRAFRALRRALGNGRVNAR